MSLLLETLNHFGINNFTIFDVGAKDTIASFSGIESISEIHAFEPNPHEFDILQKKYAKHPFHKLILNCLGLADQSGESSFLIANNAAMSGLLKPDLHNYKKHFGSYKAYQHWASCIDTLNEIKIRIERLDDYFDKKKDIDFLKLDTQGSELSILKGAGKMLDSGLIAVLKIEVATVATYEKQPLFSDIDIFLRNKNYRLVDLIILREAYNLSEMPEQLHFAPCGDAIYYYDGDAQPKNKKIKTALILNQLGYKSIAMHMLENCDISVKEKKILLRKPKISTKIQLKKIMRNILPPFITNQLKQKHF